jgi:imidazolonepropionase
MALRTPNFLFFRNARQLLTLAAVPGPRRGQNLSELAIIPGGAVLTEGTGILRVGPTRTLETEARRSKAEAIDCRHSVIMPGFVDSHTHLVFAGNRVGDYEKRLQGRTYQEIASGGGGIGLSAEAVRKASVGSLVRQATGYLEQFAEHGTTTLEVKTGYGLGIVQEMKLLKAIRRLQETSQLELVPTLLAAHSLPPQYARRPAAYLDAITRKLVPMAARKNLAEFIDCFCDEGAFNIEECRRVFTAGKEQGLIPRVHAEQLTRTGASLLAVEVHAASADHLDKLSARDIRALARSEVVATLLPGANFHLGLKEYPPARKLIEAGAIVALATDFNPGTSPTLNMQFILSIACSALRMTPAEAICAATINAAWALRRASRLGSLEPAKQADLIVMDTDDYREIPYFFGVNHCRITVKAGRIVYQRR